MTKKFYYLAFFAISYIASLFSLTQLSGGRLKFTLFDLISPVSFSLLGPLAGSINLIATNALSWATSQAGSSINAGIIHLITGVFGAWFFQEEKSKLRLIIPALCIALFLIHPIGRTVWYFPLLWLIPIATSLLPKNPLFTKSLGAVFAAHAIGGVIWLYLFRLPANIWASIFFLVILERISMALGVSASYLALKELKNFIATRLTSKQISTKVN